MLVGLIKYYETDTESFIKIYFGMSISIIKTIHHRNQYEDQYFPFFIED